MSLRVGSIAAVAGATEQRHIEPGATDRRCTRCARPRRAPHADEGPRSSTTTPQRCDLDAAARRADRGGEYGENTTMPCRAAPSAITARQRALASRRPFARHRVRSTRVANSERGIPTTSRAGLARSGRPRRRARETSEQGLHGGLEASVPPTTSGVDEPGSNHALIADVIERAVPKPRECGRAPAARTGIPGRDNRSS